MRRTGVVRLTAMFWAGGVIGGCGPKEAAVGPSMQSVEAAVRIRAIQRAALEGDSSALPHLVDRLEDEDPAVRFTAIIALERITGERFGYGYGASIERRALATARWRTFLVERVRAEAEEGTEARRDEGT
ncbi:MAG: HEAT repeat domain-containing protein [Phycisphaerae bacterium]